MEEDSSDVPVSPGLSVPVLEGVLASHMDAPAGPSAVFTSPSPQPTRRICSRPDCFRVLGSVLHDPHSVCIKCREFCSLGKRCDECSGWSKDKILTAYKYQCGLRRKREAKANLKGKSNGSLTRSGISSDTSHMSGDSSSQVSSAGSVGGVALQAGSVISQDELTADDSASQQGSKPPVSIDLSLFLESLQEQLLASVDSLVSSRLGELHNPVSSLATDPPLSALPSSSDRDLMKFSVLPPQSPDAKRCVQSHQVRGPGGPSGGLRWLPSVLILLRMTLEGSRSPTPPQW